MRLITKLLTLALALTLGAQFTCAEEAIEQWNGLYKGVYSFVTESGEKTTPKPFELDFGRTGTDGYVQLNFFGSSDSLKVTILNLHLRKELSPPTVTDTSFFLPAIFADPTEFEAKIVEGGFDEELISGKIITYKLSIDEAPQKEMHLVFKAGRLRK